MEHSQGSELELATELALVWALVFGWQSLYVALGYIVTNLYKLGLSNESKSAEFESGALCHPGLNLRLHQDLDGLRMCIV